MGTIIRELKISDPSYSFISKDGKKGDFLKNLSKINIFVGENNSGKSRFLRSIIKNFDLEFIPSSPEFKLLNEKIIPFLKDELIYFGDYRLSGSSIINDLKPLIDQINPKKTLKSGENTLKSIEKLISYCESLKKQFNISSGGINFSAAGEIIESKIDQAFDKFDRNFNQMNRDYTFKKLYIPILRGLRTINFGNVDLENFSYERIADYHHPPNIDVDIYKFRTLLDYFQSEIGDAKSFNETIFTGLNTYKEIRKHLLSENDEERRMIREFERYLSKNFFMDQVVTLVPAEKNGEKNDVISVKIGAEKGKPIYELGDGIQSIIIITLPLFLMRAKLKDNENLLVCIEEPEHLLHPSLQRKLVETFNDERFENFQFFFTTHSNHLLDISLDFEGVSIFTINKKLDEDNNPKFSIKNVEFGDDNLLNLLGVRYSSVFLPNCNIWVEGVTDKNYFRHYLKLYQNYKIKEDPNFEKFREDQHFSFFQYNGSDLPNLLDLNLNPEDEKLKRIFLIKDRDDESDENVSKIITSLKELLGDNFKLLDCREVENLITKEILLKIINNDQRCEEIDINDNFEYEDYKNERLGGFIDKEILGGEKLYEKNSRGKLNNKTNFCSRAIRSTTNYEQLSPEAKETTKKIYEFIKSQNKS